MTIAEDIAAACDRLADLGLAITAVYAPKSGSASSTVRAPANEQNFDLSNLSGGQGTQRECLVGILVSEITTPVIGDTLTWVTGHQVGTWTLIGVQSQDELETVCRFRLESRTRSNSPSVRAVP